MRIVKSYTLALLIFLATNSIAGRDCYTVRSYHRPGYERICITNSREDPFEKQEYNCLNPETGCLLCGSCHSDISSSEVKKFNIEKHKNKHFLAFAKIINEGEQLKWSKRNILVNKNGNLCLINKKTGDEIFRYPKNALVLNDAGRPAFIIFFPQAESITPKSKSK